MTASLESLRRRRRVRAQALAEFAITAPIFLFMLFAIIDFGRYVYYVQILNNAAREGARFAIVNGSNSFTPVGPTADDPTVAGVVRNYAVGVIGDDAILEIHSCWKPEKANCWPTDDPMIVPSNAREQSVHVWVDYQFHAVIPLVPIPGITITGESTLVINN
ncbi:MAG TPA: TadE/TadG family type IV pilus assembly protein [Candidatus Limnocylindrales bacterium]|nr:TadE/TadG family type IV pilus assembly protein [Candidatus Limnocylindrales bacterium]